MPEAASCAVADVTAGESQYLRACRTVLAYAEARGYRGYTKHDGLTSPALHALAGSNRWLRMLAIQLVMRAPINVRPLLGVRPTINPKGMALFTRAYLTLYQLGVSPPRAGRDWLAGARNGLDWLRAHSQRARGYAGECWGYPYDWQDAGFFAPANMPNCVVTCFVGQAFADAHAVTGEPEYLDVARSACEFLLTDLTVLHESPEMKAISYAPVPMTWVVMDTSALAGALVARVARADRSAALQREAQRLLQFVADKQTHYGAWYYSHPPSDSHITHDNYHTGFILDALLDYTDATGDARFLDHYRRGLRFYREQLFLLNGAPKWRHDKVYPHDIHGAAQGIITFARAARFDVAHRGFAERIARWTLANLHQPRAGYFYYQQGRLWTKRFTLMRWCNAWMAWALATLECARRAVRE